MSKQLAGLDQGTNLVSITIGGNDIGFIPIMTKCITSFNILCTQAVQAGIGLARSVLPNQLASTFAEIKAKAPRARLVVLGYPHLYQLGECSDWLLPDVHELINEGIDALDDVLADAAQVAGANYVDVRGEFANNEICSAHPWIRNLDFMSSSAYHPTALGQRYGYLAAFQRVTG
jgi:lysophospholipase L1-like esterase